MAIEVSSPVPLSEARCVLRDGKDRTVTTVRLINALLPARLSLVFQGSDPPPNGLLS
jgi:hypothetical protein